jgi:hypothetical protein
LALNVASVRTGSNQGAKCVSSNVNGHKTFGLSAGDDPRAPLLLEEAAFALVRTRLEAEHHGQASAYFGVVRSELLKLRADRTQLSSDGRRWWFAGCERSKPLCDLSEFCCYSGIAGLRGQWRHSAFSG